MSHFNLLLTLHMAIWHFLEVAPEKEGGSLLWRGDLIQNGVPLQGLCLAGNTHAHFLQNISLTKQRAHPILPLSHWSRRYQLFRNNHGRKILWLEHPKILTVHTRLFPRSDILIVLQQVHGSIFKKPLDADPELPVVCPATSGS